MTYKEALKELDNNLVVNYGTMNIGQVTRLDAAIDMAIDALREIPELETLRTRCDSYERTIVSMAEMVKSLKDEKLKPYTPPWVKCADKMFPDWPGEYLVTYEDKDGNRFTEPDDFDGDNWYIHSDGNVVAWAPPFKPFAG